MEAATGAAPAAAEGQPTEGQTEGQAPEVQTPDIADWQRTVDQHLAQSADGIRQLAEIVQTRLPEPAQEQGPSFEDQFAELFGEEGGGYLDQQTMSGLQSLMQQQIEQGIQQGIAPVLQKLGAFEQKMTAQELAGLQTEFPELQDQKAVDALADQVFNAATEILPPDAPEEMFDALMQNKNFVRRVHLAEKAMSRAQQETPAGGTQPVPQVETGGGAAPASTAEGDEWGQFLESRRRTSVFD
jgi:hypothetical protein